MLVSPIDKRTRTSEPSGAVASGAAGSCLVSNGLINFPRESKSVAPLAPLLENTQLFRGSIDRAYTVNVICETSCLAATRLARVQGTVFCPLKKITRPAPPALGHLGNRRQP